MPASSLKVPAGIRGLIRRLNPDLKRKIKAALADILEEPTCGKPLKKELESYWSLRVGRYRVVYRPDASGAEIVAIGPRRTIYEEAVRRVFRSRKKEPEV